MQEQDILLRLSRKDKKEDSCDFREETILEEKRFALLIDAENTSAKYIGTILDELKKCGIVTYRRMYGDFSKPVLAEWNKKALEYAIVPIMQPRYSAAKNAADIMLVIDSMDILYENTVYGFCIVSADSDFTRLASRLREAGKYVIGMGNSRASKSFISACNEYKFLDKISEEDIEKDVEKDKIIENETNNTNKNNNIDSELKQIESDDSSKEKSSVTPLHKIKTEINNIIQLNDNNGSSTNLGSLKSTLQRKYSDFDERNYGYNSMKKFIQEATKFKIVQSRSVVTVSRGNDNSTQIKDLEAEVRDYIKKLACENHEIELGRLGRVLIEKYPDFKHKEYGYSRLSAYVKSIEGLSVNSKNRVTICEK